MNPTIRKIQRLPRQTEDTLRDCFDLLRQECEEFGRVPDEVLEVSRWIRSEARKLRTEKTLELMRKVYIFEARHGQFESYMIALEWNREPEKRFYLPRREALKQAVDGIQGLLDKKYDLVAISMPPGTGKQVSDDTPVLTRNGWKNHGDLVVGDEVIGRDGEFKKVLHVFPKAAQNCRVHFSNGEVIDCHENHEWVVYDRPARKERILETKAIEARTLEYGAPAGMRGHRYSIQLPHRAAVQGETKKLPVPPYTFGAWLGDGTNMKPCITGAMKDVAILEGIVRDGYLISSSHRHAVTGCHSTYFQGLRNDLHAYGLCNRSRREEKYIPEVYLTASVHQRLSLLAGLIDTDGTKCGGGKYSFTTSEERLKDTFIDLLSTFGWRACVVEHQPTTSSSGIVGKKVYWSIQFTPDLEIPCRVERKKYVPKACTRRIAITKVERVAESIGNCIQVEGGVYLVGRKMIPTHNSTLEIFLLSMVIGLWPDKPNLSSGHSNILTNSLYMGVLNVIRDPEYCWADIFMGPLDIITNAKEQTIDINKPHRFSSLTCRPIGGSLTGATRCEGFLTADDLVSGIEEAMSKERLDKLWTAYTNDLKSRKKLGAAELHLATRWSVHDVIGRLEQQYGDDPRAKFIVLPALDENGESNFDYKYGVGFDTAYFEDMRANLDDVSWRCLFMNQPIEREGLLYHEDDLRRYYSLPDSDPDVILGVVDCADGGGDYVVMPVAYGYGDDWYIEDVVCNNGLPEVTNGLLVNMLLKHKVKQAQFESNSSGLRVAMDVAKEVKEKHGHTSITTKRTTANKETKIITNSAWVKEHCLFKDPSQYTKNSEYAVFIRWLTGYTVMGKNKHDDVPDAMAQLAEYIQGLAGRTVTVAKRPF